MRTGRRVLLAVLLGASETVQATSHDASAEVIAFAVFLAGTPLDASARSAIAAAQRRDAETDPAAAARERATVAQLMARLRNAGPVERARARERAMRGVWQTRQASPDHPFARAVMARNPILAADPSSGRVVTESALLAMAASNRFVAGLVGQPGTTEAELVSARAELPKAFPAMEAARQELLAEAESRWAMLQTRWAALPAAEQRALATELRARVTAPDLVPPAARILEGAALQAAQRAELRAHAAALIRRWDMRGIAAAQGTLHGMSVGRGIFNAP